MTKIQEVVNVLELRRRIEAGDVRTQVHPEFRDVVILNYTESFVFKREAWTPTMLACRGLIYDQSTSEVLARPLAKFFNYGEVNAPAIAPEMPLYHVGNKEDGSLGIAYMRPDGVPAIATRGSFASEQAIKATSMLGRAQKERIRNSIGLGITPLYEIVYPENRIVLDYGDREELIHIGSIVMDSGKYIRPFKKWFRRSLTLKEVLEMPPRENAEGWVLWTDPFTAVKLKQEDYVALHKIVTGLSERTVWQALMDGNYEEYAAQLPDEFHRWANDVADRINAKAIALIDEAFWAKEQVTQFQSTTRREQAEWIIHHVGPDVRGLAFSLLDGKPIDKTALKLSKP